MTIPFDHLRAYRADVDVRDGSKWHDRLRHELPNGAMWIVVGPRRFGKTWCLQGMKTQLGAFARYADLKAEPEALTDTAGCLLLDEPGPLLHADAKGFVDQLAACKKRGTKVVLAVTPREWTQLVDADPHGARVKVHDRTSLRPLSEDEAKKLARTDWA